MGKWLQELRSEYTRKTERISHNLMSDYSRLGTAVSGLTFKHLLWWDQMIDYFSITDLVLGKTKKNWKCAFGKLIY